jgi:hypothetical protein
VEIAGEVALETTDRFTATLAFLDATLDVGDRRGVRAAAGDEDHVQPGGVASPAWIEPGAVNLTARRAGAGASLVGRVTQGGAGRSDATVTIFGGSVPGKLRSLGRASVAANGAFTFRARAGTFFRARAVAPCFTAQSRVVQKR